MYVVSFLAMAVQEQAAYHLPMWDKMTAGCIYGLPWWSEYWRWWRR